MINKSYIKFFGIQGISEAICYLQQKPTLFIPSGQMLGLSNIMSQLFVLQKRFVVPYISYPDRCGGNTVYRNDLPNFKRKLIAAITSTVKVFAKNSTVYSTGTNQHKSYCGGKQKVCVLPVPASCGSMVFYGYAALATAAHVRTRRRRRHS